MKRADARALQLGDIVVNTDPVEVTLRGNLGLEPERGIVIWATGHGVQHLTPIPTRYVIEKRPGLQAHLDIPSNWRIVPRKKWTAVERARSAALIWDSTERVDPYEVPSDCDTTEWRMLIEMLPPKQREQIWNGNLPSLHELLLLVAAHIDDLRTRPASKRSRAKRAA